MARLAATMATGFGVPEVSDDVQTSVDFEVGTTNNLDMAFSVGDAPTVTDDGTFEVRVPVALIVRGRGHKSRTELLHCSRLVAQCVSVYGDGDEAYRPAFFFNVTWFDNAERRCHPDPAPVGRAQAPCPGPLPTPLPSAFPSVLPWPAAVGRAHAPPLCLPESAALGRAHAPPLCLPDGAPAALGPRLDPFPHPGPECLHHARADALSPTRIPTTASPVPGAVVVVAAEHHPRALPHAVPLNLSTARA